jgi:hypothetical protein
MNERIRELAEQARAWAETAYKQQNEKFTSHWDTPVGYTPSQFFEQKFAELIVKETMQVVANQLPSNQYLDVAHSVIEHFGVER